MFCEFLVKKWLINSALFQAVAGVYLYYLFHIEFKFWFDAGGYCLLS